MYVCARVPRLAIVALIAGACVQPILHAQEQAWRSLHEAGQEAFARGDFDRAERLWTQADMEARSIGLPNAHFVETRTSLGILLLLQWRYNEASGMLQDANRVAGTLKQEPGADSTDVDLLLASGTLDIVLFRLERARQELTEALRLTSERFGSDHPKTAKVLAALGQLSLEENKAATSVDSFRRAVGILNETVGPVQADTIAARISFARALLAQGPMKEEAQAQARQASEALRKLGSAGQSLLGDSQFTLGLIQSAAGRALEARSSFEAALSATTATFGGNSLRNVPILAEMAEISLETGEPERAREFVDRAQSIHRPQAPADWAPLVRVLSIQARTALRLNRPEEAEMALTPAAALASKRYGDSSLQMAAVLETRGDLRLTTGDIDKADADYRQALRNREEQLPPDDPEVALSTVDLARIYQRRGLLDAAETQYKRALQMLESTLGQRSFRILPALEGYDSLLVLQKRTNEAKDLEDRIARIRAGR